MNRQHSKTETEEIARGLWKTGTGEISSWGITFEGQRHKYVERRRMSQNQHRAAEIRALSSKSCDIDHELKGFEEREVGETQGPRRPG